MIARGALLLGACLALATGEGAEVRVEAEAAEVEFGAGFPVTVVRTWDRGRTPAPWDDGALAPLVLRAEEVETREEGGRVEETRRFRAFAFQRGILRTTAAAPLVIRVRSSLDPRDPGPPEWPAPLLPPSRFPWAWALAAAAAAAGGAALLGRRRRPTSPAPMVPRPDPRAEALRRLAALRGRADLLETAALLREFLDRAGMPAPRRTTEEVLADARTAGILGESRVPRLGEVLGRCDLAKFALDAPGAEERERLLVVAEEALGGGGAP